MTDFTRQRSWFDPDKINASVTVVGCGGVGSFTAVALAKLGVRSLRLVDPDVVEEHNIPNQMFPVEAVGQPKVVAMRDVVDQLADDVDVETLVSRLEDVDQQVLDSDVVVSALDSMEARVSLWERLRFRLRPELLLDARLAGQYVVLYSARPSLPSDVEGYEQTLYSDEEALEVSCTARSIIDVGFVVASLITRAVRQHYAGEPPISQVFLNQEKLELFKGGWS